MDEVDNDNEFISPNPEDIENASTEIEDRIDEHVLDDSEIALRKIRAEHRVLSSEEQLELVGRAQQGDLSARDRLLDHSFGLIFDYVDSREAFAFGDLFEAGAAGFLAAIETFDQNKGASFSTYASILVERSIQRHIDRFGSIIRIPVNKTKRERKIVQAVRQLNMTLGRGPNIQEIALATGLKEKDVQELLDLKDKRQVLSLDDLLSGFGSLSKDADSKMVDHHAQPDETAEENEREQFVARMLKTLDVKERQVIILRQGLTDEEPLTLEEIGERLHVSKQRVWQIEEEAVKKLRALFSEVEAREFMD